MADVARQWLTLLHDILPRSVVDVLNIIYFNAISLTERLTNPSLASLMQSLLPPLISVFAIYFTLISLYRTTTFFVRSTIFLVKWGVLIGAVGVAFGYIANMVAPDSLDIFTQSTSRTRRTRSERPHAWDSFETHYRWRETQRKQDPYTTDAGRIAREIMEKLVDATQGGWWGAISGLAAKAIAGEDSAIPGKGGGRRKDAKGKGRSR